MLKTHSLIVLWLVGLGCAGNGTNPSGDVGVDAPAVDSPPPAPFVGAWRDLSATIPEHQREIAVYAADGKITFLRQGVKRTGFWRLEPSGELTVGHDGYVTTAAYYLTEDRFVVGKLDPVGPVNGVVGTWKGTTTYDDGTWVEATIDLREDHTHAFTRVHGDGVMTVWEGTYTYADTVVLMSFTSPGSPANQVYVRALEGVVLGSAVYERLTN